MHFYRNWKYSNLLFFYKIIIFVLSLLDEINDIIVCIAYYQWFDMIESYIESFMYIIYIYYIFVKINLVKNYREIFYYI